MAYRMNEHGPRDKAYPSEIAALRPIGATRIHCSDEMPEQDAALRGSESDNRVARFNEQLRSGLGTGRPDNTDE
jgi:hypothetical protein